MRTNKTRPTSISFGDMGLLFTNIWSRVRIDDMRMDEQTCLCFHIDLGFSDWYPINEIYVCDCCLQQLPAQAVVFSLFGHEDLAVKIDDLKWQIDYKNVIGKIISTKEEYDDDAHIQKRIKIVIYDESGENLNSLILKEYCESMSNNIPKLDCSQTYNSVVVTHVDENDNVYCQLEKNGMMQYIQKQIHNLMESKFDVDDKHRGLHADMATNQLYLVYDSVNSKWYRASLISPVINKLTYNMRFIDYGITRTIIISKIYRLNSLSADLCRFPGQAFKIRLAPIPVLASSLQRLRGLLPNRMALVKISGYNQGVPLVHMFIPEPPLLALTAGVNQSSNFENDMEKMVVCVNDIRIPVTPLSQYNVSNPASELSGRNDHSAAPVPIAALFQNLFRRGRRFFSK
jgi:hypothetical protein